MAGTVWPQFLIICLKLSGKSLKDEEPHQGHGDRKRQSINCLCHKLGDRHLAQNPNLKLTRMLSEAAKSALLSHYSLCTNWKSILYFYIFELLLYVGHYNKTFTHIVILNPDDTLSWVLLLSQIYRESSARPCLALGHRASLGSPSSPDNFF